MSESQKTWNEAINSCIATVRFIDVYSLEQQIFRDLIADKLKALSKPDTD